MTKRRRLTRIRVLENTSFNFEDVQSHTNTSSNTKEGRNMNSNVGNEGSNTRDDLNGQTQIPSSFEFSRSLRSSTEIHHDESDIAERSVKCRGPTILTDIWNQPPDEKWVVKFNKQGQPYGDDSTTLSSFIGTIGRNPELAPQGYSDWRLVPKEYKDRCMNEIKLRFTFPRFGEEHILKALGRTVKDFRGELKAMYYEPNKHNRSNLVNAKPPRVPKDQWLKLISYWDQDKTKRRATINRINQKNQNMPHCAGRRSFAQLRADKTIDGVEPSRAQIFIDTHKDRKTRDKRKLDEESAKAIESMKEKLDELPNGIEKMDGKIAWKGDIFDQVIGKEERRGRVRGVGGNVCATKLWGTSDAHRSSNSMESNEVSSDLVNNLFNSMSVMEQKHSEELQKVKEKSETEIKRVLEKQDRLESLIQELVGLFTARAAKARGPYSKSTPDETDSSNTSS